MAVFLDSSRTLLALARSGHASLRRYERPKLSSVTVKTHVSVKRTRFHYAWGRWMIPHSAAFRQCPPDEKNQPLLRERYLTPPVAGYERKSSAEWTGPVHREGKTKRDSGCGVPDGSSVLAGGIGPSTPPGWIGQSRSL